MATFTFIMERDNDSDTVLSKQVHLEFDASPDITHMDLTAQFKDFLSACGYIFDVNDQIGVINEFDTDENFVTRLGEEILADSEWEEETVIFPIEDEI